jgi:hypothetical protein
LSKVEETTEVMKEPFVFKFPQWQLVWTSKSAIYVPLVAMAFLRSPLVKPKIAGICGSFSQQNMGISWVFHWGFDPSSCGGYPSLMCNSGGFPWNARNPSLCGRTGKGWCLRNRQAHFLAISERLIGKAANFADWEWFNIC